MKPVTFIGDALDVLRDFSAQARSEGGYQIRRVQDGCDPDDWKPMPTVGLGGREIRVRDKTGAFRVIDLATRRLRQITRGKNNDR
jgi:phage-related protein